MAKLWLTYAWKDNEDEDVDHIISELTEANIEVRYDRVQLLAGLRLWDQIDANIRDPEVTAWAIYVTENSLKSEPCQEELAYALDRTLRTRGATFPLIGLFAGDFDGQLIPSALATRLCVNLHSNEWRQQVSDALSGERTSDPANSLPYGYDIHKTKKGYELEVWPRTGTWTPFQVVVSEEEAHFLKGVTPGPRGPMVGGAMLVASEGHQNGHFARQMQNPVNRSTTAHIHLSDLPAIIGFGQPSRDGR
ncbi:unnamed protein product, partial [Ectocarpus sp. 12 AP-2014]